MQYENYERKVNKVANFMKLVFKHMKKIIITASVMLATTVTLLATRGIIVSAESCPLEINYGEELAYSADAFISKVTYEYKPFDEDEWSSEMPKTPGVYNVRAVAKATFGYRYGKEETFTIHPKPVTVYIKSASVVYGDMPSVNADMAFSDTIECSRFVYNETGDIVKPDPAGIKAVDPEGNDVSSCYVFSVSDVGQKITIVNRPITVTVSDVSKMYDGLSLTSDKFTLDGTLASGDRMDISFVGSITAVGNTKNNASIKIFNAVGDDVTYRYDVKNISGTLTVTERQIVLTTGSKEWMYDALVHDNNLYSVDGDHGIVAGHTLTLSGWADITNVGSMQNSVGYAIKDSGGNDVSKNYKVNENFGTLSVTPRPIIVETHSNTYTYDGSYHTHEIFTLSGEGLGVGDVITLSGWNFAIDAGSIENSASSVVIENSGGYTVTDNYTLEYKWGELTVNKLALTLSSATETVKYTGSEYTNSNIYGGTLAFGDRFVINSATAVKSVGVYENKLDFTIYSDSRGLDVTDNYDITFNAGTITVTKRYITVSTENRVWTYEGYDLFDTSVIVSGDGLAYGEYTVIGEYTTVKNVTSGIENRITVSICASGDVDVSANYEITYDYGTLTVERRQITLSTDSDVRIYSGEALSGEQFNVYNLVYLHEFKVISRSSITNVGTILNEIYEYDVIDEFGESVLSNYTVSTSFGTLTVDPRPITVTTASAQKMYDAAPLTANGWYILDGSLELVLDHRISAADPVGSITNVGSAYNGYVGEVRIFSDLDGDVTYNYDITVVEGILTVDPRPIIVVSGAIDIIYDGKDHFNTELKTDTTVDGFYPLCDGHSFYVVGYTIYNGVIDGDANVLDYYITDGTYDLTYNYEITEVYGRVEIAPRPITVYTNSIANIYDGKYHYDGAVYVNTEKGYPLCDNHAITVLSYGSYKDVVFDAENIVDFVISATVDGYYDIDVTENYDITYEYGSVNISHRKIKITNASYNAIYDGYDHTNYFFDLVVGGEYLALADYHSFLYGDDYVVVKNIMEDVENAVSFIIIDEYGEDVTYNYDTEDKEFGRLTVERFILNIAIDSTEYVYDGTDRYYLSFTPENPAFYDVLIGFIEYRNASFIRNVGSVENNFDIVIYDDEGIDATYNFVISTVNKGVITVVHRHITVTSASEEKPYDGEPLTAPYFLETDDSQYPLIAWHTYTATFSAAITIPGTVANLYDTATFRIYDEDGVDVTSNYVVDGYEYGTLTVTKRYVTLESATDEKVYDGTPLTNHTFIAAEDSTHSLVGIHKYVASFSGTITIPGTTDNTFDFSTVRVYENGVDVTQYYVFEGFAYGTLTVTKRHISVNSVTAEKEYDGTPLTAPYFVAADTSANSLLDIHSYQASFTGKITNVGTTNNTYISSSFKILDVDGNDVTDYYVVDEFGLGTLTVLPSSAAKDTVIGLPEGYDNAEMKMIEILTYVSTNGSPVYFREMSFGEYTGRGWSAAIEYTEELPYYGGSAAFLLPYALLEAGNEGYDVMRVEYKENTYVRPYYGIDLTNYGSTDVVEIGDVNEIAEIVYYANAYYNGYYATGEFAEYEEKYAQFVYGQYCTIDDATYAFMMQIIEEQGFDVNDPNVIGDVAEYIQNAASYDLKYDRRLDQSENIAIAFLRDYKTGICQHYATAATLLYRALGIPARYTVGFVAYDTEAEKEITVTAGEAHAWVEVYVNGLGWVRVEVTGVSLDGDRIDGNEPSPDEPEDPDDQKTLLNITVADQLKIYDGTPLYAENKIVETGHITSLLALGYTYDVVVEGVQDGIGRSKSRVVSFTLYNEHGEDVTDQFEVKFYEGNLEITYGVIEIYLYSKTYEYSGSAYTYDLDEYLVVSAPDGITLEMLAINVSLKNVGTLKASSINHDRGYYLQYAVYLNGGTEDLSAGYIVNVVDYYTGADYEVIKVVKRQITVTTNSATKSYDEKPLRDKGFYVSMGMLPKNFTMKLDVIGSITAVGSDDNTIDKESLVIYDENGEDVTKNFQVTFVLGTLTVV